MGGSILFLYKIAVMNKNICGSFVCIGEQIYEQEKSQEIHKKTAGSVKGKYIPANGADGQNLRNYKEKLCVHLF